MNYLDTFYFVCINYQYQFILKVIINKKKNYKLTGINKNIFSETFFGEETDFYFLIIF